MKKIRLLSAFCCLVGTVLLATSVVQAQPFLLDSRGGVEVWSVPQPDPGPGYEAANILLRASDPTAKLVTFENVAFEGELVQTWLDSIFGTPTSKNVVAGPTYPADWIPYDSHLNISSMPAPTMIGGEAGNGFTGINEENDMSIGQIPGLSDVMGVPSVSGIGSISMVEPTDAFFLDTDFQTNEVNLAYLVAPKDPAGAAGHISMTLGVLGEGIVNSGDPGGAQWGFGENPEPLAIALAPVEVFCISQDVDPSCMELLTPGDAISGGQSDGTNFNVGVAGTAAGVNNWPAAESPDHAIDGVGQKYLNFGETDTGFVVTPSGPTTVGGIKLWTANDAEPRDPASFQVWGTNADVSGASIALSDFTAIAVGTLDLPSSRNAGGGAALDDANSQTIRFLNDTEYNSYLVLFPGVKDAASANSMQIAEVQLLGIPEPGSLTLLGLGGLFLGLLRRRSRN